MGGRPGGVVLVVDDDASLRELISIQLQRIHCTVYEAGAGDEALDLAYAVRPDLVILDVSLPRVTGYEVCRELRDSFGNEIAIIFVSGTRGEALDRVAGLLIGADDYLAKPFEPDELLNRARTLLARSQRERRPRMPEAVPSLDDLTPRERQILVLLARGGNQNQIATELVISPKTVATHIQRVLAKLGVHSRAQAVAYAHRVGLVEVDVTPHFLAGAA